jgi:integrase
VSFIEKREGPRGRSYRVRTRDPLTGELLSETFSRKADAEDWLHTVEASKSARTYRDPRAGKEPFGTYLDAYLSGAVDLAPSTMALYRTMAERYVRPGLGRRPLAALRPQDVRSWIGTLADRGVGAPTIAVARRLVVRVLRQAVDDGIIPSNPAARSSPPRSRRKQPGTLSVGDVHAIADAIDPRYKALVLTQAFCALRFGEVAALRRSDIDMHRRRLTISRALSEVRGVVTEGAPKTEASIRTITMPNVVVEALTDHLGKHPGDLVFPAPDGGFIRRTNWTRRVWRPALEKAGLSGVRPHDLRHFGAALAIAAGGHPKQVQARLGHASIRTTLDVYGSLFPSLDEDLADRLDEVAGRPEAEVVRIDTLPG